MSDNVSQAVNFILNERDSMIVMRALRIAETQTIGRSRNATKKRSALIMEATDYQKLLKKMSNETLEQMM